MCEIVCHLYGISSCDSHFVSVFPAGSPPLFLYSLLIPPLDLEVHKRKKQLAFLLSLRNTEKSIFTFHNQLGGGGGGSG